MLQTIKIKGTDNVHFISDCHFNHLCAGSNWKIGERIFEKRGYVTSEDHTEGLIAEWNKVVDDESIVFSLGDLILNSNSEREFMSIIPRLKFKQLMILWGNHNASTNVVYKSELKKLYPDFPEGLEIYPLKTNLIGREIIFLGSYAEIEVGRNKIVLSHYPIASFNGQGKGAYCLSGHCHQNLPFSAKNTSQGRILDMSVEGWGRPVSISEIREILDQRDYNTR